MVDLFIQAIAKRLLAEMTKDVTTSQDNLAFFENVKSIFPQFTWTDEDEMGFSVKGKV